MLDILNTAQTGLTAAQTQVENVMNNTANETTEGYKRRVVDVSELGNMDSRITGTGVSVDGVSRVTDVYMYQNLIDEKSTLSSYEELDVMLNDIESIFYETDDSGLSADLNRYFQSVEDLRTSPENEIYQDALKNNGDVLVTDLKGLYSDIESREKTTLNNAYDDVNKINSILNQIGDLSKQINNSTNVRNDLLDKRDSLEEELSKYIDVEISREDSYELKIGGTTAVRFDTNVHSLNLVENYIPQADVYTIPGTHPYKSSLINKDTWDNSGDKPDSVTYILNNEVSVTVAYGDEIDIDGDGTTETVDENNIVRAVVAKINTNTDMLGKVTAYNGDPDGTDPEDQDNYLVIKSTLDGEKGKFVGQVLVVDNNNTDSDGNIIPNYVEKSPDTSKDALDDIHLEIFDEEVDVKGGSLSAEIDNLKTESGDNKFTEYKEKLDLFAKALSDLSSGYIEHDDGTYVFGKDASEIDKDNSKMKSLNLFTGSTVSSLTFYESGVNSLNQDDLDYLAQIQWKDDVDFDGTGENTTSFSKFYQGLRVNIANDRETVIFRKESQTAVTESLQNTYDKLTKVDNDQEMVDLIKFQSAYEANAKLITTLDEMLKTILAMKQ